MALPCILGLNRRLSIAFSPKPITLILISSNALKGGSHATSR